ncbi:MAG: hypothetical protein KDA60_05720 [Planctomycetales bacterium]|nr:hypothetical protein [Planctomycetales bacterium]
MASRLNSRGETRRKLRYEELERREVLATLVVANANDSGDGSLRNAIVEANGTTERDTITFDIGIGVQVIRPQTALPAITNPLTIDGTSQPGYSGIPLIELDGAQAGDQVPGLTIDSSSVEIRGLSVSSFDGAGIHIVSGSNSTIAGNYVGLLGGNDRGIQIE